MDEILDAAGGHRVQRRGRLVEQEQFRIGGQRTRDAQTLLLAAAQGEGHVLEPVLDLFPERTALQRRLDPVVQFVAVAQPAHAQTVGHVLVDRLRERIRLLEHHADAHPHFDRIHVLGQDVHVVGLEDDLAFVAVARIQVVHAVEAAQQRALAAAAGADQRRDLVFLDRHRDALEALEVAIVEAEVAHLGLVDRSSRRGRSFERVCHHLIFFRT